MDGGMEGWRDGGMDGWMEGWMDGWMDGWMFPTEKDRNDNEVQLKCTLDAVDFTSTCHM